MNILIFQVDAFASRVFAGNPAAVCILDKWLDDHLLQNIAAENNLSETAFIVKNEDTSTTSRCTLKSSFSRTRP